MADEQQPKTAADIEREQEELFKAKYGGLRPKKKILAKEKQYFDSADWALAKEGKKVDVQVPENPETLPPKLEPTALPPRRVSKLDPTDTN